MVDLTKTLFFLLTHSVSGVAEDLPNRLVDRHIQYGSAVAQQHGHRIRCHKSSPQSDRSVTTSCNHQLQRRIVVETFSSLKWDKKTLNMSLFADREERGLQFKGI